MSATDKRADDVPPPSPSIVSRLVAAVAAGATADLDAGEDTRLSWSSGAMDRMLALQDFRQIVPAARHFVDDLRDPVAVDWVLTHADEGHVPLLYLAIRNAAKVQAGTVLESAAFRRIFVWFVYMLLRVAQDHLATVRAHGQQPRHDVYVMLRDKVAVWLAQFPAAQWPPLRTVLAEVAALPGVTSPDTLPPPAWLVFTGPGQAMRMGLGAHIDFKSPLPEKLDACACTKTQIDAVRAQVARTFVAIVTNMQWSGFLRCVVDSFAGTPKE